MPVLEDGLSSGHASDTDNNNPTVMLMKRQITEIEREINQGIKSKQGLKAQENGLSPGKECLGSSPIDIINGCVGSYEDNHVHPQIDSLGTKFFTLHHLALVRLKLLLTLGSDIIVIFRGNSASSGPSPAPMRVLGEAKRRGGGHKRHPADAAAHQDAAPEVPASGGVRGDRWKPSVGAQVCGLIVFNFDRNFAF